MFKKILIANRGEIAVRVIRACREMGIRTVAVFSEADRTALHVRWADEAILLGPAPAKESYLRSDKILEIAKKTGADAVHPGYGFLSENADFSDACQKAGLQFIGPRGESMRMLGDKVAARRVAAKVKVPTVPGMIDPLESAEQAKKLASEFGYPVLLKARSGGGGKGMRKVLKPDEIDSAYRMASSEAESFFKDPVLYLEKYIEGPHHVEVQILGDRKGNVVAVGERECSIQRRHQKIIEESPSPFIREETRKKLLEAAVTLAREARYENAGTLEFLVDQNQRFYFLEMNARLQVEHPVTEQVTGIDLVKAQLAIAAGEALTSLTPPHLFRGEGFGRGGVHAIECRIYAEDPDNDFLPSPGKILRTRNPEGPGVRVDSAIFSGSEISVYYDPMIAKLITWGRDRGEAIGRMERALREYQIIGLKTNIAFHEAVLSHPDFRKGHYDTSFVDRNRTDLKNKLHEGFEEVAAIAAVAHEMQKFKRVSVVSETRPSESPWRLVGRREGLR